MRSFPTALKLIVLNFLFRIVLKTRVATPSKCSWEVNSYGYHGDDGKKYCGSGTGTSYGPTFHAGDIIGVGLNTESNSIFFTRNGSWLGVAFKNVCSDALYPTVGLHSRGERVSANFGTNPFTFDIKARESEENIFTISDVSTEQLHTSMTHQLVKDYLRHHGHANTLKALDKKSKRSGKSSELSDELLNLNERSLVNSLIVRGKAGAAKKRIFEHVQTDESHPTPDELGLVALYLSCQECVELVRRGEISTAVDYATTAIRTGVRRDHIYNGFIRDRIALLGYEIPGQSRVGSLLNLCERDDVARAVSTTLLTPEYHLTHVSRNLRARIRKTHMTADINIPWGLSHQRVPPSPKLKGGEIDAESKRPCQDHKVPVIRASADTAVHGFGSRAEFFIQQKLVAQSILI